MNAIRSTPTGSNCLNSIRSGLKAKACQQWENTLSEALQA
jgi:hypothetical protein